MNMFNKDLFYGSFGPDVFSLQRNLQDLGYGQFVPTGFFGTKTLNAVIQFQEEHSITPHNGRFGPITRKKMNAIFNDPSDVIYETAIEQIGIDASPADEAPDEYGCAETASTIIQEAGLKIGFEFPVMLATAAMYDHLRESSEWRAVAEPKKGNVIISPTGHGNGKLPNGHVGIMFDEFTIMSNHSADGIFEKNYNLETWKERYGDLGGFPIVFFEKKPLNVI